MAQIDYGEPGAAELVLSVDKDRLAKGVQASCVARSS